MGLLHIAGNVVKLRECKTPDEKPSHIFIISLLLDALLIIPSPCHRGEVLRRLAKCCFPHLWYLEGHSTKPLSSPLHFLFCLEPKLWEDVSN